MFLSYLLTTAFAVTAAGIPYNTFDGDGSPACNNVKAVYDATSIADLVSLVQDAARTGTRVRASGKGHMWYDTMCSDDPNTIIIRTEALTAIKNLDPVAQTVTVEAGVTFMQLAAYLHDRGWSVGNTLVNWNITLAGCVAMGAHRSSIREHANVVAGVVALELVDGRGDLRTVVRDETDDVWLAASTSLGLLGVITRLTLRIYPDYKVFAMQEILDEEDVFSRDIRAMIAPYATANLWWWPYLKKFHYRYYDQVPTDTSPQQGFQSTFSATALEALTGKALLDSGKILPTSNMLAETIFFHLWEKPNFREKTTNTAIDTWPVYGWNYDVLIGGLYDDQKPVWEYGLKGYTLELAVPVQMAGQVLRRVRELFDDEAKHLRVMTSTYRSGINIKFGKAYKDFLGQTTYDTADGVDWTQGVMMFDFPSYKPSWGDHLRYNEPFYHKLAKTLIDEFPARPHWTKNTRDVFAQSVKNLDPNYLARFKAVREQFDPNGVFRSVVGEIIGVY